MKAIDSPYQKIINNALQFVIPVFQRDYSWREENCRQLWNDVMAVAVSPTDRGHFIGSVVYIASGDSSAGFTKWLLIDGQQRVTTLTIMLTALRDHIRETAWSGSENGPTAKRIEAYFLRNVQEEGDREVKLRLRREDDTTLQALISGHELPGRPSSRIVENYELFRELLHDADPEAVYEGVSRLIVVDVVLDRGVDDPQMIFESLNSTGVDLSSSDLIRNFILMGLPEADQTRLYEMYWSKIEALFRGSERVFDNFVRDFLALRMRSIKLERSDRVYLAFRREFANISDRPAALEELLRELLRRARHCAAFAVRSDDTELGRAFRSLSRLGDVPAILIMRLYDAYAEAKTLSLSDFVSAVRLVESYLLRRTITGAQTRGYGTEFARMALRIDDHAPLDSLRVALARLSATYAFPDDTEFEKSLTEGDIYHKRVCFHLLEGLENRGSKEISDTSGYSVEHILPQNDKLDEAWRHMLGPDWPDVQAKWLHRLGNLTLTGYNSTYSDRPFSEKKSIAGGFNQSSVRLNQDVREAAEWTGAEISARGQRLAQRALKVWPRLDADPKLIRKQEIDDKIARSRRRDVTQIKMSHRASQLLVPLRSNLKDTFPDLIEMAETKSVTYHDPEFFIEVLFRKHGLSLLLALDYNEIEDTDGFAVDTSDYAFVTHATHDGGVLLNVKSEEDVDKAMSYIHRAHELQASA